MQTPPRKVGFFSVLVLAAVLALLPSRAPAGPPSEDSLAGALPAESAAATPATPAAAERDLWPERQPPATAPAWNPEPVSGAWVWRYLLSLLAVGGLMAGVFLGLRRMRNLLGGAASPGGLRLVARLPLDRHNTVYLLRTAGETLVLAGGARGVRVLARQANDPDPAPEPARPAPSFFQALRAKEREN